nr:YoaP domain-containing protein [Sporanaerobium hydrogeniformans]
MDSTDYGYELLALSFDGAMPRFTQKVKNSKIDSDELTIYYDMQCPFVYQNIEKLKVFCETEGISAIFNQVDTLEQAKELPCVFNNYSIFYKREFETVNQVDVAYIKRLLKKGDQ